MATSSHCSLFCVSGWLEISSLRYAAVRALDGVQPLCSLVVDSITSPYIDGREERIPSKFDQWDYKPPRTRSFKPHLCCLQGPQYITPSVQCIYQSPPLCSCRSTKIRWTEREEHADQTGVLTRRGLGECGPWSTAFKWRFEWVQIHHGKGAVASMEAIYNDRRLY